MTDAYGRYVGWVDPDRLNKTSKGHNGGEAGPAPEGQSLNLICSALDAHMSVPEEHRQHRPVLDIDFEARLIPSSTPGHYHLYLDGILIPDPLYKYLLKVLAQCGIIQENYAKYSIERGYTAVRKPGDYKPPPPPEDDTYQPKHMIREPVMVEQHLDFHPPARQVLTPKFPPPPKPWY